MRNKNTFLWIFLMILPALAGAQSIWTGAMSSDWNNPNNWAPAGVPNSPAASVLLPVTPVQPKLATDISVRDIFTAAGTSLDLNSKRLKIYASGGFSGIALSNGIIEDNIAPAVGISLANSVLNNVTIEKNGAGNFLGLGGNVMSGTTIFDVKSTADGLFKMGMASITGDNFTGTAVFKNQSPTVDMSIAEFGVHQFLGDIRLSNTGMGSITFGANFGLIAVFGSFIDDGITNGNIKLNNITQAISGANNLGSPAALSIGQCSFSGDVICLAQNSIILANSAFNGNNTFLAPNITQIQSCIIGGPGTVNSISKISAPSSVNNSWFGNNKFRNCTITNSSNADLRVSASLRDTFFNNAVFENSGGGFMEIAYNDLCHFGANLILRNTSSKGIRLGSTNPAGFVTIAGNLKTTGFSNGPLELRRLDQQATTPNDLFSPKTLLGKLARLRGNFSVAVTDTIVLDSSIFNRSNLFTAPNIANVIGSTFSDVAGTSSTFNKTGGGDNNWSGNNTFGAVEVINGSPYNLRLANAISSEDRFNGKATFNQTDITGVLNPCSTSNCLFRDTISTLGTSTAVVFGGISSGRVVIDGNKSQVLLGAGFPSPVFRMFQMSTTGSLVLKTPLTITGASTFSNGVVFSDAVNLLLFNNAPSPSGGSINSHLDGPAQRISVSGSPFTFPLGNNGQYAPVTVAPSGVFGTVTAQYFHSNPAPAYSGVDATLDHVSTCEYWDINRLGGGTVTITFPWDNVRSCGVNNLTDLRIARWNGANWTSAGGMAMGGPASGTVPLPFVGLYGKFTLASVTAANPLPIELLYFSAKPNSKVVDLHWATQSEKENDYFTVERSRDGNRFEPLRRVNGAGNSNQRLNYFETDQNPLPGVSYYRLRQTDFNGEFSFSNVEAVQMPLVDKSIAVYPNPVQDFFYLDVGAGLNGLRYRLINSMGEIMRVAPQIEAGRIRFSASGLAAGLYFLEVQMEDTVQSFKVVIR